MIEAVGDGAERTIPNFFSTGTTTVAVHRSGGLSGVHERRGGVQAAMHDLSWSTADAKAASEMSARLHSTRMYALSYLIAPCSSCSDGHM